MLWLQKPKLRPTEPPYLDLSQTKTLVNAIIDDRERGLVYLYLGHGLRLGEALGLNIGDVLADILVIRRSESVNKSPQSMPLLPEAREVLIRLAGGRAAQEPIFLGQRGRLKPDMAELVIKRLFARATDRGEAGAGG